MDQAITLALWQGESVGGKRELAFTRIASAARAAGAAGAVAITFPEMFLTGYDRDDLAQLALTRDEIAAQLAPIAQAAGCAICLGYPERVPDGVANAAICVGANGAVLGNHRKIQLYGVADARRFVPGDAYTTFELAGRKAAMLICYDVEFAPHIGALRDLGVKLLLVPTAAMRPFEHIGEHVVPAMAANYGIGIVYANMCGPEGRLDYFGGSVIVGPHGKVLARGGDAPCLLMAEIAGHYSPGRLSTQDVDLRRIGIVR